MGKYDATDQGKKKVTEIKTFPVPFALGEIKKINSISSTIPSKPSKEQIMNQAIKFHLEGNISEAAKFYQNFINQGFTDHRVFSNYGVILQNAGKLQEADISYRKAIQLKPDFAEGHSNLGNLLKDLGNLNEAEISYRKAIQFKPAFLNANLNLATVLKDLGNLKEAEVSNNKIIQIKPDFAEAHSNLGIIYRDLGKLKESEVSLRKAIELKPNFSKAHLNLGLLLGDLGKSKQAESSTRKAIELEPNLAVAHYNLGNILRNLGQLKEAVLSQLKAIELSPNYVSAYSNLGTFYRDLGKLDEAKNCWLKAIKIDQKSEKNYELAIKYLVNRTYGRCQSLLLSCLLCLDKEKEFNRKISDLSKQGICNAEIGGIVEHANIIYDKKHDSPFCNEAIKYVMVDQINKELFSDEYKDQLINYFKRRKTDDRSVGILMNGKQTSGNLFSLDYPFIQAIKKALELKIELYKKKFKNSNQGFINNWPSKYELRSWMIGMKTGGYLQQHNHEYGWITGSFYLQVPDLQVNDNSGSLAFSYQGPQYPNRGKDFNMTFQKLETRDICIFPSSLFHQTIPFTNSKERICFVFDLIQKI